jgi:aspartate/methionine/tyrosine aminotransferase
MEWAKLRSRARFNLATSGVADFPLSRLPVRFAELEINGPTIYGYPPLQERLAAHAGAPAESIVAAAGTSMANHLAIAALIEPGDEVLVEHPTYELLLSTAAYLGASIRRFPRRPEDRFRLDPEAVRRAISPATRLVVATHLHNPSSVAAAEADLREVGAIAAAFGARVLVDEVYRECVPGAPSAFFLGPNFVVTSSLTKAYGLSGLRCGWIVAPPDLAHRMWRINDLYGSTPVHPAELLSVVALDNLDTVAERARALLSRNREALDRFLDGRPDLDAVRTTAGTTCFPRLRGGRVERLCAVLRDEYETSVVPGEFFEMPGHFRIGIGGDPDMVAEGLDRLARALDGIGE